MFLEVLGLPKLDMCVNVLGRLPICVFSALKHVLEALGLPKLILCVLVLGRLPLCVFSAPRIVFTSVEPA